MELKDYSLLMILREKGLSDKKFNELRQQINQRNKNKLLNGAKEVENAW